MQDADHNELVRRLDKTLRLSQPSIPSGHGTHANGPANAKTPGEPQAGDEIITKGLVELGERYLTLEANSVKRARRGAMMLKQRLGSLAGRPLTSTQSVKSAMADRPRQSPQSAPAEIPPEEQAKVLTVFLDRHYRGVLDEPVPMVGNVTPREAVLTEKGRKRVAEWLKYMENAENHRARMKGQTPYDFGWIWQKLGIDERRH